MRFLRFHIQNFKGIQDCVIDVDKPDPRVFSLIGLNESGKTTILEAINYFVASDKELQKVYDLEPQTANKTDFVPKSKKLNFNGTVSIAAHLQIDAADVAAVDEKFKKLGYVGQVNDINNSVEVVRSFIIKIPISPSQIERGI